MEHFLSTVDCSTAELPRNVFFYTKELAMINGFKDCTWGRAYLQQCFYNTSHLSSRTLQRSRWE